MESGFIEATIDHERVKNEIGREGSYFHFKRMSHYVVLIL